MDLGNAMLDGQPVDFFLVLAIPKGAFEGDELSLLEGLGEFGEVAPGKDAMPLGAGLVVAFVVLPALLGCNVEDDELFVVLGCFGFCVLSEVADEE